jgi:Tfp pilus assembly protein FimT
MNTSDRSIRPCDAPSARRRADRVSALPHSPAFTLVELTIVLAIVVAVSAMALPRYWSSVGRYRVDMAARRLAADLTLAQSRARTTAQFRNVVFDATLPYYELPEENSMTKGAGGTLIVDLSKDPFLVSLVSFSTTDGSRRVTFDGFGQPAQGLSLKLSAAGHTRTVSVDQSSGAISVTTP